MNEEQIKVNPQLGPHFVLIDYIWWLLSTNAPEIWSTTNYDGMIPIVPLADQPELAEFSGPRVIYEYATGPSRPDYFISPGTMTLAIIAPSQRSLSKSLTILQTAFERHDETAADVNHFSTTNPTRLATAGAGGIGFGTIRLQLVNGGSPTESEGGPVLGVVTILWDAMVEYNVTTRP